MGSSPDPDEIAPFPWISKLKHLDLVLLVPLFFLLDMLLNKIMLIGVDNVYQKSHMITNETSILIYDAMPLFENATLFPDENFTSVENESLTFMDKESLSLMDNALAGNELLLNLNLAENESYFMATNDSESALSLSGHLLDVNIPTFFFIFFIVFVMLIILSPWKSFRLVFISYAAWLAIALVLLAYPPFTRFHFHLTDQFQLLLLRFFIFSLISGTFFELIEPKHRTRWVQFAILLYLFVSTISPYTATALEFSLTKYVLMTFLISLSANGITFPALYRKNYILLLTILLTFPLMHVFLLYFQSIIITDNVYGHWEEIWRNNFHDHGFSAQRVILLLSLFVPFVCLCSESMRLGMDNRSFVHSSRATLILPPILFFIFTVDREYWYLERTRKFPYVLVGLNSYLLAIVANCCQRLCLPWKLNLKRENKVKSIDIQLKNAAEQSVHMFEFMYIFSSLAILFTVCFFYFTYNTIFSFIFIVYTLPVSLIYYIVFFRRLGQHEKAPNPRAWRTYEKKQQYEARRRKENKNMELACVAFLKVQPPQWVPYDGPLCEKEWRTCVKKQRAERSRRKKEAAHPPPHDPKEYKVEHARKRLVEAINGVYLAKNVEYLLRMILFFSLTLSMWAIFIFRLAFHQSLDLQSLLGGIYYADVLKRFLQNKEHYAGFMNFVKVVRRVRSMNQSSRRRDYVSAECSICNEVVNHRNRYVMTPCNHHFHKRCLLAHLLTSNKCYKCKTIVAVTRKPTTSV